MPASDPSVFDAMFEGPNSVFGRMFGSMYRLPPRSSPPPAKVRVKISKAQLAMLVKGESLNFKSEKGYILLEPSGQ